jgi:hypothetical protein
MARLAGELDVNPEQKSLPVQGDPSFLTIVKVPDNL